MKIGHLGRASLLAMAIASTGITTSQPTLAAVPQAEQLRQQLASYHRDRTELESSIEQAERAIARARASGDTQALNVAIAQRGRLRAELRALDATTRIVAGIAKDGATATATYQSTLETLERRVSDSATAVRLARDELEAARAGGSDLSVTEANQALQLAARQYRNSRLTVTSFSANSAEIKAAVATAQPVPRAAAGLRRPGTDAGAGSGTSTGAGSKPRKGSGAVEATEPAPTLVVTPITQSTAETTTASTQESDSVFATLAAIAEVAPAAETVAPAAEPASVEVPVPVPAPAPEPDPVTQPPPQEPVVAATEPPPAEPEIPDAEIDAILAETSVPEPSPVPEPVPEPEPVTQPVAQEPIVAAVEPPPPAAEPTPEPAPEPTPIVVTGTATLSWSIPITRANGAPLAMGELRGYELYVMAESTGESQVIVIDDPLSESYTVGQLAPDIYHFAIAAVDSEQRLSELSEVVTKTIADTSVASSP